MRLSYGGVDTIDDIYIHCHYEKYQVNYNISRGDYGNQGFTGK